MRFFPNVGFKISIAWTSDDLLWFSRLIRSFGFLFSEKILVIFIIITIFWYILWKFLHPIVQNKLHCFTKYFLFCCIKLIKTFTASVELVNITITQLHNNLFLPCSVHSHAYYHNISDTLKKYNRFHQISIHMYTEGIKHKHTRLIKNFKNSIVNNSENIIRNILDHISYKQFIDCNALDTSCIKNYPSVLNCCLFYPV